MMNAYKLFSIAMNECDGGGDAGAAASVGDAGGVAVSTGDVLGDCSHGNGQGFMGDGCFHAPTMALPPYFRHEICNGGSKRKKGKNGKPKKYIYDKKVKIIKNYDDMVNEAEIDDLVFVRHIPKNEIEAIVDNAGVTNKRFEIDQFLKYFSLLDDKAYEIVGIFSKTTRKCAAMAILNFNYLNENDCYCCEAQALQSGKSYGKTLLESIAAQFKHFWFMANVDAGEKLVNLYKAMPYFNELHVFPSIYDDNEHPERKGLHLFYTKDMPSSAIQKMKHEFQA